MVILNRTWSWAWAWQDAAIREKTRNWEEKAETSRTMECVGIGGGISIQMDWLWELLRQWNLLLECCFISISCSQGSSIYTMMCGLIIIIVRSKTFPTRVINENQRLNRSLLWASTKNWCNDELKRFCSDTNWHHSFVVTKKRIQKLSLATEVKKYAVIFISMVQYQSCQCCRWCAL